MSGQKGVFECVANKDSDQLSAYYWPGVSPKKTANLNGSYLEKKVMKLHTHWQ